MTGDREGKGHGRSAEWWIAAERNDISLGDVKEVKNKRNFFFLNGKKGGYREENCAG